METAFLKLDNKKKVFTYSYRCNFFFSQQLHESLDAVEGTANSILPFYMTHLLV